MQLKSIDKRRTKTKGEKAIQAIRILSVIWSCDVIDLDKDTCYLSL